MYKFALKEIIQKPLFGYGPGSWKNYYEYGEAMWEKVKDKGGDYYWHFLRKDYIDYRNTHFHNLYLDTTYQTGLIGLIVFLLVIIIGLRKIYLTKIMNNEKEEILTIGILFSLIVILIISLLDGPLFGIEKSVLFFYILGMGLILSNKND